MALPHPSPAGSPPPARAEASAWDMEEVAPGAHPVGAPRLALGRSGRKPASMQRAGAAGRYVSRETHLGEHYPKAEGACVLTLRPFCHNHSKGPLPHPDVHSPPFYTRA